ncbi:hypothetical protein CAEBREN_04002 [Caenorhabditis brenneri]|uniref:Uncharacterized protein n=1 Tax=Caenorhabditis brenneri TaxID=135651 RepID=G0PHF8_CAEBE|nr:hypothetical protein CAEBREN_04002 [Caenorhabditis brenneri]
MASLVHSSLIPGYLDFYGITFCEYPHLFFLNGSFCNIAWMTDCFACILLAIERCVEVNPKFCLYFLLEPKVFRVVRSVLIVYAVYSLPDLYRNYSHAANNLLVAVSTTTLYFYLCYYLIFKYGYSTSMWLYKSKRQIILQGVILCFFHAAAGLIYEYMQSFPTPQWLIIVGHVVWQMSCGCLSIVYLTLNRTIRNSVLKMLIPKRIRKKLGLYIGVEEHLAAENGGEGSGGERIAVLNAGGAVIKFDNYFQN